MEDAGKSREELIGELRELRGRLAATERRSPEGEGGEKRYRDPYRKTPAMVHSIDAEGRLLSVSDQWLAALGYRRDEVIGRPVADFFCEESRLYALREAIPSLFEEGEVRDVPCRMVQKNGETLDVLLSAVAEIDASAGVVRALAVLVDVSRQKRAEKALLESEGRFRSIYEHTRVGIGIASLDGRMLQVNGGLCRFLGYGEEDLRNLTVAEFTHPEDRRRTLRLYREMREGARESLDYEKRYERKDMSIVWGRTSVSILRDSEGEPLCLLGMVQDITERKEAERALQAALAESEETKDRADAILKSVADALIVTSPCNRVMLMNKAAEELLGIAFDEAFNRPVEEVVEEPNLKECLLTTFSDGECCCRAEAGGDGGLRAISLSSSPITNRDGSDGGRITILRDVSREREMDRMKSEFISTAAHELRTPLTTIMGFSELLLEREDLGEESRRQYLSYIVNRSKVLSRIIGDLLDLSRVESGRLSRLDLAPCHLGEVVERLVGQYRRENPGRPIELSLPESSPRSLADEGKIVQVLENLLTNALKFSPEGSAIAVECEDLGKHYRVAVRDEGIGMGKEQVARIFDKFYRADGSNTAVEGLGLGMSIALNIVEAHGGEIVVESEPGRGTTISFSIPSASDTAPPLDLKGEGGEADQPAA